MKDVQIKVPGKLYIAGEYAVVEPGHSAIITTVNLFIKLKLSAAAPGEGTIYSEGFTSEPVNWQRVNHMVTPAHSADTLKYLLSAINTTEEYLRENGIELTDYHVQISSELDNPAGHKLGLGSSGAVTVATVQGLLEYFTADISDILIYKLSVISQMRLNINSSFGDLAASTYTGWIQYTSFDRTYVNQYRSNHSLTDTIDTYWPKLSIKRISVSKKIQLLIGWTGSPASSNDLVGAVQDKKEQTEAQYEQFLNESKVSILLLVPALENKENRKIKKAIQRNRQALLQMGQETNVMIETPLLTKLIEIAEKYGGAAKTSGAGGGDSGIAFLFNKNNTDHLINDWADHEITHLPVNIYRK